MRNPIKTLLLATLASLGLLTAAADYVSSAAQADPGHTHQGKNDGHTQDGHTHGGR